MGVVSTISYDRFPEQSRFVGERVNVVFEHDFKRVVKGTIVRDDKEEPFKGIIQLDDGRLILMTECQYEFLGSK